MLTPGDPTPRFYMRGTKNPRFAFDSVAGRYVLLSFIGSAAAPGIADFLQQLYASPLFDDEMASAFIVSHDAEDERDQRLPDRYPGIRIFWDDGRALARLFDCAPETGEGFRPFSFLLDPGLRILAVIPLDDPAAHFDRIVAILTPRPSPALDEGIAPVLIIPNLFEPELCRDYIAYAEAQGLTESGSMRTDPVTGKTIIVNDHMHKRRADCSIADPRLRKALEERVINRLNPQIMRAYQFAVTRMERYLIACYDSETGGHFRPHKDNTTLGTAHRRFAVSIGLNAEEYDGGDLRFPEFGMRSYRPPTGGAVVFSCSLLHEVLPITAGRRYAILPFLYDEAAAQVRAENAGHLEDPRLRQIAAASAR